MQFSEKMKKCVLCTELKKNRTNVVVGDGPIPCNLVFLGEATGKREDLTGVPFSGTPGTILRLSAKLVGLPEGTYNALYLLKCRPPDNREPRAYEIANCLPFLLRQLDIIKPRVILALGQHAIATTMGVAASKLTVSECVNRVWEYNGITCMGTYHPAFVLRNRYNDVEKAFRRHLRKARRLAYEV